MHVTRKFRRGAVGLGVLAVGFAMVSGDAFVPRASALPIGFGINHRDRIYQELKSDNFIVYHDSRVPTEGWMTLNALEGARPFIEKWFDIKRQSPLTVVTSAATENASFADFITDAIELQTSGQGTKDLAWHEYTHSSMYRHFDNFLGPAGALINLPWMPAWFLEGLAEMTSVSVGSDVAAGIERYQALSGDWPTYDRLHSLYAKYGFFERGYATSGSIVTYIMKKGQPAKLPVLLDDFYDYTMPWFYPRTVFGLNYLPVWGMMPMDKSLENFIGMDGYETYTAYKKDAASFWNGYSADPFLVKTDAKRTAFSSTYGMRSDGTSIRNLSTIDGDLWETALDFDAKTGWATGSKKLGKQMPGYDGFARANNTHLVAGVKFEKVNDEDQTKIRIVQTKEDGGKAVSNQTVQGIVFNMWETPTSVAWIEQQFAKTRLCQAPKPLGTTGGKSYEDRLGTCPIEVTMPKKLRTLGAKPKTPGSGITSEIWVAESDEKLKGTLYTVKVLDAETLKVIKTYPPKVARPLSVAFAGPETYLLLAEKNIRVLEKIDAEGQCASLVVYKDHILDAFGLANGSLVLSLYGGDSQYVIQLKKGQFKEQACHMEEAPTSPLQFALTQKGDVDLRTALAGADQWTKPDGTRVEVKKAKRPKGEKVDNTPVGPEQALTVEELAKAPSMAATKPPPEDHADPESHPAKLRPHPLFLFPWIGGDDAYGLQFGLVSVPLVDRLQDYTLRTTFLYGPESHFPNTEMDFTVTRWRPTLNLAVYRQQTYNALTYASANSDKVVANYFDERGVRLESSTNFDALGGQLSLGVGIKFADLKPYLGRQDLHSGKIVEPASTISLAQSTLGFNFSNYISGRIAPKALDHDFDYNQLGFGSTVSRRLFWDSTFSLGLEGGRTRGTKRRALKELYQPLKTFIPGSGGGYNQNSYPFVSSPNGLFTQKFGENEGRAKANYTIPVLPDIDKQIWLLYCERLDFTAFYNYGGAWNGQKPSQGWDRLTRSHGYNLDLQLENKGVRFNAGLGTGQVIGEKFEVYGKFGFDALF